MCCSVSSIQNWFYNPIEFQKEKCRLLAFSALALFVIGLATICFVYGENVYFTGYNKIFAYVTWGLTGGAILSTVIAYIAKGVLSFTSFNLGVRPVRNQTETRERTQLEEEGRRRREATAALAEREKLAQQRLHKWHRDLFQKFFPEENYKEFPGGLIDSEVFDHDEALQKYFASGDKVVRGCQVHEGKQCPFIGLHLAIHQTDGSKTSAILFIVLNMKEIEWNVYGSPTISGHMLSEMEPLNANSNLFVQWVEDILNDVPRRLLTPTPLDGSEINPTSHYLFDGTFSDPPLIEKEDALRVSLWN